MKIQSVEYKTEWGKGYALQVVNVEKQHLKLRV